MTVLRSVKQGECGSVYKLVEQASSRFLPSVCCLTGWPAGSNKTMTVLFPCARSNSSGVCTRLSQSNHPKSPESKPKESHTAALGFPGRLNSNGFRLTTVNAKPATGGGDQESPSIIAPTPRRLYTSSTRGAPTYYSNS